MSTNPLKRPDGRAARVNAIGIDLEQGVAELLQQYRRHQEQRGLRPLAIKKLGAVLRLFAEWMHSRGGLGGATEAEVIAFLDGRRLSARTRYHYISSIHCFYEWAVLRGRLSHDPTLTVPRPRFPRAIPRPIPDDELNLAIAGAAPRELAIIGLAAFHGLRAGEIAAAQREDILERNDPPVIVVPEGKGGHQRVVPLHPSAWGMIAPWVGGRRGWIFPDDSTSSHLKPHRISHVMNAYLHELGSASTLHSLRHWYGTKLYASSRDLRVTQALMGHASPNTTVGYVAWASLDARGAVEGIPLPRLH